MRKTAKQRENYGNMRDGPDPVRLAFQFKFSRARHDNVRTEAEGGLDR
jgi:hypothetical protein